MMEHQNPDVLKELAQQKEKEWKEISEKRFESINLSFYVLVFQSADPSLSVTLSVSISVVMSVCLCLILSLCLSAPPPPPPPSLSLTHTYEYCVYCLVSS